MGGESTARRVTRFLISYPSDCQPSSIEYLGNAGGFSGAQFWKLNAPRGWLCVRLWPKTHPSVERLEWIHDVLKHVHEYGCGFVPVPIPNSTGNRFIRDEGHLWELSPWMPGISNLAQSRSTAKLAAAMHALATFHTATATARAAGCSEGLRRRHDVVTELLANGISELRRGMQAPTAAHPFHDQCIAILQLATPHIVPLRKLLEDTISTEVRLQPCLRDIWHDHFLFTDDVVTGLIDFGAMRIDTIAGDLARLLGSLTRYHESAFSFGLTAYQQIRSLSEEEVQLVRSFHWANTVLSGLNWVRWLAIDQRRFENLDGVKKRLSDILWNLESIDDSNGFGFDRILTDF